MKLTRKEVESWPALGPMNLDKARVVGVFDELEAEHAKVARLRSALEYVWGELAAATPEDKARYFTARDRAFAALADTAPDAPPVASELDAAHARIAELEEARVYLLGRLAPWRDWACSACDDQRKPYECASEILKPGFLCVQHRSGAEPTRGIGPEAVAKVRACLEEAVGETQRDAALLEEAFALLPEPR